MVHQVILGGDAPIHKDVSFSRVPVHVAKDRDLILPKLLDKMLTVVDGRVKKFGRLVPSAVEVYAQGVATVVAPDDAIRVEHRDYLEDELLSQKGCLLSLGQEVIN